jgi:vacuolar iron transporter family protein
MSWSFATEQHRHPHQLLGDILLGLNDGIATTLVFVLGVAGAAQSTHTVVLVGLAELLGGGVSMTLGGFVSAQSQKEAAEHQIDIERQEIEHEPEEERQELTDIYREKGFSGPQLSAIVEHLTSDKERWLNSLIRDELLLKPGEHTSPWKVAAALGLSFAAGALLPLFPFIFNLGADQLAATVISIVVLFVAGAGRSRYSHLTWTRSGANMIGVGLLSAGAGVVIGKILSAFG